MTFMQLHVYLGRIQGNHQKNSSDFWNFQVYAGTRDTNIQNLYGIKRVSRVDRGIIYYVLFSNEPLLFPTSNCSTNDFVRW